MGIGLDGIGRAEIVIIQTSCRVKTIVISYRSESSGIPFPFDRLSSSTFVSASGCSNILLGGESNNKYGRPAYMKEALVSGRGLIESPAHVERSAGEVREKLLIRAGTASGCRTIEESQSPGGGGTSHAASRRNSGLSEKLSSIEGFFHSARSCGNGSDGAGGWAVDLASVCLSVV